VKGLRERIEAQERWQAQVDARGVLMIGCGIVLTGIPDELAVVALLGWAAILSVLVAVAIGVKVMVRP
jgi:hypothetical protein